MKNISIIKIFLVTIVTGTCFFFCSLQAQNNSIFNGGGADGFTYGAWAQTTAGITGNLLFKGGIADGFAMGSCAQANAGLTASLIHKGGVADGFATGSYSQTQAGMVGNVIYTGGIADGFAAGTFTQANSGLTGNSIFIGGIADGFATGTHGGMGNELPLPVELLSFNAVPESNSMVLCHWETAAELNNDYFTVERSRDNHLFEAVGMVNGSGNSTNMNTYTHSDVTPYAGISYYRLRQTDFDGKYSLSKTVAVHINTHTPSATCIYPNPVTDTGHIKVSSQTDAAVSVFEIIDLQGRLVYSERLLSLPSVKSNEYLFQKGSIKPGIYLFRLGNKQTNVSPVKLVIQ